MRSRDLSPGQCSPPGPPRAAATRRDFETILIPYLSRYRLADLGAGPLNTVFATIADTATAKVDRRAEDYVSLRRGVVGLGLGPVAKLPEQTEGQGFTRQRLNGDKGAGVEIVLELDGESSGSTAQQVPLTSTWVEVRC